MSIPQKYFQKYLSLLSDQSRKNLIDIEASNAGRLSSFSVLADLSRFSAGAEIPVRLDYKYCELEFKIDYLQEFKDGLIGAHALKKLERENLFEALSAVKDEHRRKKEEFVLLKRQRKIIEEDILEMVPMETIESAYSIITSSQVKLRQELSRMNQTQTKGANQVFQKAVKTYYDVVGYNEDFVLPERMVYCMVTRNWWLSNQAKAVHIVPKLLQSEQLSYLFGVDDVELSDPRNGLMLHNSLAAALDRGDIAIVPVPPVDDEVTEWKLILTKEALRSKGALKFGDRIIYWKDLDETTLHFRNSNQPHPRFLYLRYIMTYLTNTDLDLETERPDNQSEYCESKWCLHGPYVRKSMLQLLARQISDFDLPEAMTADFDLPEAMYAGFTFTDPRRSPSPSRSSDEEYIMAMALGLKVADARDAVAKRTRVGYENVDEEDNGDGE